MTVFLILWLIMIFVASVISVSGPKTRLPADKVVHFVMYGLTSIVFFSHFIRRMPQNKAIYLSILCASAYGVALEFLQSLIPRRSFSPGDMAANAAGALIFCILYVTYRNVRGK